MKNLKTKIISIAIMASLLVSGSFIYNKFILAFQVGGSGNSNPTSGIITIFSQNNFPAAVANVITLDGTNEYRVIGTVSLSSGVKIDANGSPLSGRSGFLDSLQGNVASSNFLTSTGKSVSIRNLQVSNQSAGGSIFDFTGDVPGNVSFECVGCQFLNSDKIGTVTGAFSFVEFINNRVLGCEDGVTIQGNNGGVFFDEYKSPPLNNGTFIDIPSGLFGTIMLNGNTVLETNAGDTAIDIDNGTATIGSLIFSGANVTGTGTLKTGFVASDSNVVYDLLAAQMFGEEYDVGTGFMINSTPPSAITAILDEDDMVSDSATALATQQSIKAFVDSQSSAFTKILDANNALYPSTNPAGAFSRNSHPIIVFDDATAESVIFPNSVGSGYSGEDITVNIDWVAETATTGGVTWGVSFEANSTGGNDIDLDSFSAQQTGTDTTNATSGIITTTSITLTQAQADAIAAGDYFRMELERVVTDGDDDMVGDAQILKITLTN